MTRITRTALLLVSALLTGAGTAAAQTINSPFQRIETTQSIHVFGGYLVSERDVDLTDSTSADFGFAPAPVIGLRYQIRASGPLSVEAAVGFSPSSRRLFAPNFLNDSTRVEAEDLEVEVPASLVTTDLGLRFHFTGPRTWNGLAPFVMGMGGLAADVSGDHDEEKEAALEDNQRFRFGPSFAVGAGLGTDWFPTRNISLRLELQGRLWRMETPEGFTVTRAERSEWNRVGGLTVGGAIHF